MLSTETSLSFTDIARETGSDGQGTDGGGRKGSSRASIHIGMRPDAPAGAISSDNRIMLRRQPYNNSIQLAWLAWFACQVAIVTDPIRITICWLCFSPFAGTSECTAVAESHLAIPGSGGQRQVRGRGSHSRLKRKTGVSLGRHRKFPNVGSDTRLIASGLRLTLPMIST